MNTFVRAYWSDLILLSYAVPDELLTPCIGPFQLDKWNGKAYVSVVGFHFGKTRILGVSPGPLMPKVSSFAQWNLRTYVQDKDLKPGIVFLKEFVPSPMVTGLVRTLYKENYVTSPLSLKRSLTEGVTNVEYSIGYRGRNHSIITQTTSNPAPPDTQSADYFFVERYWGSPGGNGKRITTFHIEHAPWKTFEVSSCVVTADYAVLYGEEWGFLNECSPEYVAWCDGSEVEISWPTHITVSR